MLWTLLLMLVVLWALDLIRGKAMGGLIHLLLVVPAVALATRLVAGRSLV